MDKSRRTAGGLIVKDQPSSAYDRSKRIKGISRDNSYQPKTDIIGYYYPVTRCDRYIFLHSPHTEY